jgi:hypothetical protein
VLGHPTTKTEVNPRRREVKNQPYANYCRPADPARYTEFGLDPKQNIILVFDERDLYGKDGLKQNPPQLNGMSGCPIWLLADEEQEHAVPPHFEVVGIFTDHKKRGKRVLIGTDIGIAFDLIRPFNGLGH